MEYAARDQIAKSGAYNNVVDNVRELDTRVTAITTSSAAALFSRNTDQMFASNDPSGKVDFDIIDAGSPLVIKTTVARTHPGKPGTTLYGSDFRLDLAGWWRVVLNGSFWAGDAQFNRLRAWWLAPSNNQGARYGGSMFGPNGFFTGHSCSIFRPFNKGDSISAFTFQDTGSDLSTYIAQNPVNIAFEWVRDL
jgi:hypothetical protein